ncbi:topoisomerase acting in meiosis [Gymnopilus junonius]|uniref:DNA topoisomerase (ATP-hydrolyzing) n=1 Tax=Gymnopilus junonius TaxID=109634 RepID=A0A9P5NCK1_GYMJU|nr:topoisomerase acting in meiosis [Gymnopilus junonius]
MILSFLTQLAFPGGHKIEESDYKVEIRLADRRKEDADEAGPTKCLRFPKKSSVGSAKTFAQLFRVLDLAHEAKLNGVPTTKRDIYYKDVALFKSQKVVDTLVDDLAATFQLERSDLNIRSSSKGLICGSGIIITLFSGECIRGKDSEGTLIPAGEDIETFSIDESMAWVLIVEKEAVFQTLCRLQICSLETTPGRGIMITGKGYPDVATRHLVKSLADALPRSIPILALVDGDPFGLDILSVYKYGSRGMQHENGKLAARRIKWLGVWASELERLNIDKDQLLPITKHDEKKALSMLRREHVPARWRKELQHMLHMRRKVEIEILSSGQVDRENKQSKWERQGYIGTPFTWFALGIHPI